MVVPRNAVQRIVGACVVAVLWACSLMLIAFSAPEGELAAAKMLPLGSILLIGGVFVGWLLRGRDKGQWLVFAPRWWLLWFVCGYAVVSAVLIIWRLSEGSGDLLGVSFFPMLVGAWTTMLFRREDTVKAERETKRLPPVSEL